MSPRPVLLLTVDSVRYDRLTEACFPESMPLFEEDFAIYTNALSHGVATPFAFPGIVGAAHVVGDKEMAPGARTLAERLPDHRCVGFSNNGLLSDERGYHRGFDEFYDLKPPDRLTAFDRLKQVEVLRNSRAASLAYHSVRRLREGVRRGVGADDPLPTRDWGAPAVAAFVRRQLETEPSSFVWAHFMDPHTPYHPDKADDSAPVVELTRAELADLHDRFHDESAAAMTEDELRLLEGLYDSNVRYFDRSIADLLGWVSGQDWYNDALIILVSDHGDLFGEHGYTFHPWDADPYDELIHAPLLVKYPEGTHAGDRFDHLVQHRDIAATVVDVLDIDDPTVPDDTHPLSDASERRVVSKSNTALRLTEPDGTLVVRRDGSRNLDGDVSEDAERVIEETEFPTCRGANEVAFGVEAMERRRQLKELGYLQS